MNKRTEIFDQHRGRLFGVAYRMLGSRADAEDMLQETYLRWHKVDLERIQSPIAWLTTTISRLCIDRLRAMRTEREAYSGPWLPEPLIGDAAPADRHAELASDLSVAFMVVLEQLAPEERAAFLLHDVFECSYPEIARTLGKNEANCRQMVSRARARVKRDKPRFVVSEAAHRRLLTRFIEAMKTADRDALVELFAEDAEWTADGGGKVPATSRTVSGRARVAKMMYMVARKVLPGNAQEPTFHFASINGRTGIVVLSGERPIWALALETDGTHILAGYNLVNPDKLARLDIRTDALTVTSHASRSSTRQ